MATRVFELARELGVTSKVVLEKCRAEGIDVKNHMATLSAGLEATIREWFSEGAASTAVETTAHVDLEKARKEAKKSRRRRKTKKEEESVEEAGEGDQETDHEAEEPAEEAEPPQVEAEETESAVAEAPSAEFEAEAEPSPSAEPEVVQKDVSVEKPAEPEKKVAAPEKQEPEEKEEPKSEEPVKPAGPQVVPKPAKLKGPRVVRVEQPDYVPAPRPRQATPSTSMDVGSGPATSDDSGRRGKSKGSGDEEEGRGKKGKRRSPRRRGGRSADSGEGLREWRDKDLMEREARLAAATGGGLRRHRASVSRKSGDSGPSAKAGKVEIDEPITVKSLSAAMGVKAADIIRKLMDLGTLATINNVVDVETAETMATEYGIELAVRRAKDAEKELAERFEAPADGEQASRAPVVTFLGHVDHGKTSLLDRIRDESVAAGEAGGITQHIGAYRYEVGDRKVTFLDTPGHEAFTAMRARGANMTDVVVLVVAADDGVMPQTAEAISHAKAAGVPIVVALNKIDLPNANPDRALGQLTEYELQPREWGGNTEVIRTSAQTGEGIDDLVETLSLEAELLELKAVADAPASGFVIEAEMDPGLGVLSRLLVRNGTLKVGDIFLAGKGYGRVRQMRDSHGRNVTEAGPSTPVEVAGLDEMPEAGDRFYVVESLDEARAIAEERRERARIEAPTARQHMTLESLFGQIQSGQTNELAMIIKADVQGSVEALVDSLNKLSSDEVRVNILHTGVGGISTGDVALAEASDAIIIGFNVVADSNARQMAETEGVDIRLYRVIYDIIEDVRKAMEEGLAPEVKEEVLGRAEVRQVFKVSRIGTIAGCYVTDGVAQRNAKVRLIRDNVVIEDERTLDSLKRFKDDAREVRAGMECGVKVAGYDDIKEGDILEFYRQVEVARKL